MKILIQSIFGHRRPLLRSSGCRYFTASPEEYAKRNYANNLPKYNTVIVSIVAKRRPYLLRDVYDDMMLDGVHPTRDTFNSFIVGTMRGARLQDAFFFRDEMGKMGLVPDVNSYNFLISTCGKCQNSDHVVKILEEIKKYDVKPNGQTYVCLLNACAATANLDQVYAIIRDMTAAGAGLNDFCYAGLITAYMNKRPVPDDAAMKIIEFVEQSRGWSSVESASDSAENTMMGVSKEELYNLPTADYINKRGGFLNRQFAASQMTFQRAFSSKAKAKKKNKKKKATPKVNEKKKEDEEKKKEKEQIPVGTDVLLQTDGSMRVFKGDEDQHVYSIAGVILFPKARRWGGCFREFSGLLTSIDNAEVRGVAVGLEHVVWLFLSGKICAPGNIHIRYDNAKVHRHLDVKRKPEEFQGPVLQLKKRIYYAIFLLTTHGFTYTHTHIDSIWNKFADKLANDGAKMLCQDKNGEIGGNLTVGRVTCSCG